MIVYVYDKKSNEKVETVKDVYRVSSDKDSFIVHTTDGIEKIQKKGRKLVVYGF